MTEKELPWIILITHGNLGKELLKSVEMIAGKLKHTKAISLMPEMAPEELAGVVKEALDGLPEETLILTDLFGGTPSNVSAVFARRGYKVMAGVNMPMVLAADMHREGDEWGEILQYLSRVGPESIVNVSEKFN